MPEDRNPIEKPSLMKYVLIILILIVIGLIAIMVIMKNMEKTGGKESADAAVPTPSAIRKMKKADLIELAQSRGVEIDPKATNADMAEAIIASLEA